MERLRPWGAGPDELSDPLQARQLDLDTGTDNLGLPMSGLILRTPTDVLRVWRADDGERPAAAHGGRGRAAGVRRRARPRPRARRAVGPSDVGGLPAAATDGLRAFYRQDPSRQLQLAL